VTFVKLREMANDAEILYALADLYDCDDMSLVNAYLHCKDNDQIFSDLCAKLLSIRTQSKMYNKVLSDCVKEFPIAALRINLDVVDIN